MALTVSARSRFSGPSTASLIKGAAICAAVGIGSAITEYADLGKWLAVLGVLLLIVALHRFGRMGADPAIVFELAPVRKRKKKKPAPRAVDAGEPDHGEAEHTLPPNDSDS